MRFHYGGKYEKEEDLKAERRPHEGAVAFREPEHTAFAIIANGGYIVLLIVLLVLIYFIARPEMRPFLTGLGLAAALSMLTLIPHEFLHALCFKEDVYLYFNFSKFLVFVHGTESMSKSRFIFMSLLPNLVFGVLPLILFFIKTDWYLLGAFGAFCLSMGFGDYINVFNAAKQMPKGARTYLDGFHSYWYRDENADGKKA